jgi:hypothetical protein
MPALIMAWRAAILSPIWVDDFGGWADELDAAPGADLGQHRVFREKAVAWMKCVTTRGHRQIDDAVGVQVADHGVGADVVGFIGLLDVQRVTVGVGVYRYRANAHFLAGADDPDGDFTTVGDEYFLDHVRSRAGSGDGYADSKTNAAMQYNGFRFKQVPHHHVLTKKAVNNSIAGLCLHRQPLCRRLSTALTLRPLRRCLERRVLACR